MFIIGKQVIFVVNKRLSVWKRKMESKTHKCLSKSDSCNRYICSAQLAQDGSHQEEGPESPSGVVAEDIANIFAILQQISRHHADGKQTFSSGFEKVPALGEQRWDATHFTAGRWAPAEWETHGHDAPGSWGNKIVLALKTVWKRDLGLTFGEKEWMLFQGFPDWYPGILKPGWYNLRYSIISRLLRLVLKENPDCWKCRAEENSLLHDLWTCPKINDFWYSINDHVAAGDHRDRIRIWPLVIHSRESSLSQAHLKTSSRFDTNYCSIMIAGCFLKDLL